MTTSPGGPPATPRISNDCRPLIPVGEMTDAEIAWYRSNRERCWDCLCCLSTCKCRPKAKRGRAAAKPARQAAAVATVIRFPALAAVPAPAIADGSPEPAATAEPAKQAADIVQAHLRHLELAGMRPDTVTMRRRCLARLSAALAVPLAEATAEQLYQWRASLAGLSTATVCAYVKNAKGFYAWLAEEGLRPDNPAARIPVPRSPEYKPRPISEEALSAAIGAATGRVRIWLVLAACGLRACEIAALRRSCVREHASPPVLEVMADATKGGRHGRVVHLPGWAVDEIEAAGLPSSGWCFPPMRGKKAHVQPHLVSHLLCSHLHSLGYADTGHALRHLYGTALLDGTGNLRLVQDQMGHLNIQTTTVYTKVNQAQAAAAAAALPDPRTPRHPIEGEPS